jgi:hypothetical protein
VTTGCTNSTLKLDEATVLSHHISTENSEELFQLIGVDGNYFKGNKVNAGPHIFYVRGLQTTQQEKQLINETLHSIRVKINAGSVYQIMSESTDQEIKVWLQDKADSNIVSAVSKISVGNVKVTELTKVIPDKTERIRVFGKKSNFAFEFKPKDACKFKKSSSDLQR